MKAKERIEGLCFLAYAAYVAGNLLKARSYARRVRALDLEDWLYKELMSECFGNNWNAVMDAMEITRELKR